MLDKRMRLGGTVMFSLFTAFSWAAETMSTQADLMAVISLQGLPCVQVTDFKLQGDHDYLVTCKDGNRYHVFINATGRVVAKKQ